MSALVCVCVCAWVVKGVCCGMHGGDSYQVDWQILDPREVGFPVARRRQYAICVCRKLRMLAPFGDLKQRVVQQMSTQWSESEALSVDDFILAEPLAETQLKNHLTEENFRRMEEYRRLHPQAVVADLGQNPGARARCGTDYFPTLTTTCTKLMHLPTRHIFSLVLSVAGIWDFL